MKLNFERIKRKILNMNLTSILFVILSIITATFAWISFSKVVNNNIELDIIEWKINLTENNVLTNNIGINIEEFAPGSTLTSKTVNISNVGNIAADLSYEITSLRIFDIEYDVSDQTALFDLLAQSYPFTINFYLSKDSINVDEDANFMYSIEWPYESGNDLLDSIWYNNAYDFNSSEEALHASDSSYVIRDPIEINVSLKASQNAEYVANNHVLGETKLFDITDNSECDTVSSTCLSHYLVKIYDNNLLYMVNPSSISETITANDIDDEDNETYSLYNFFEVIKSDIIDTDIVIPTYSNRIFGNSSVSTYDTLKGRIISNNGKVQFKSSIFNYLISGNCYWINESYDDTHTFAVKNADATYIELYPELNTNSCKYLNFVNYKIDSNIVTFNANGGDISSGNEWNGSGDSVYKIVNSNSQYGILPTVTRNHFSFDGWYDIEGNEVVDTDIYSTNSDNILYAHWTPDTITVTYDANGGNVSTSSGTQYYYSVYSNLPTPTKSGYSFKGWYTASSGGIKVVNNSTVVSNSSNHTLYARWYVNSNVTLYDIVANQASSATIDFDSPSSSSGTNGVYTTTSTESGEPVYYYRGNVDNHLIFNDMCWRIIRTTETGGVKLIYNGTPTNGTCVATGTDTMLDEYGISFNVNENDDAYDNAYVGYMYGTVGGSTYAATHTNTHSSTVKTYIDNWYSTNFTSSSVTSKIEDTVYCNDRSIVAYDSTKINESSFSSYSTLGYGTNGTLYSATQRASQYAITLNPTLVCSQDNDKFTVSSSNGNGALTYPVGLITTDEAVFAGFNADVYSSNSNYLYSDWEYWTMSPIAFYEDQDGATIGQILDNLNSITAVEPRYVRPVISLASGVTVSGSGTSSNPYVVVNDTKNGKSVTVTYNANGGSVDTTSGSQMYNYMYSYLPTPTRSGYTFDGWYTASSGGTKVTTSTVVSNSSDHTLYAHWANSNSLYYKVMSQASDDTINFSVRSGTSGTNGVYKTTSTDSGDTVYYYRGNVDNHVIFNNMCWRIVRTTETGGVKLIYNGTPTDGTCVATGSATQLSSTTKFNSFSKDNAYVGYMYGSGFGTYTDNGRSTSTTTYSMSSSSKYYYGTSYTFNTSTGYYSLSGTKVNGVWSSDYVNYYTCRSSSSTGTCQKLLYTVSYDSTTLATVYTYSYTYNGSTSYNQAHTNTNNSTVKSAIDTWYSTNFTNSDITSKIEDTVYCNDRSTVNYDSTKIYNYVTPSYSSYGNLGYGVNDTLYGAKIRASYFTTALNPTLACVNDNDKFTVSSSNGNGALTYPVGLITLDEAVFAGFNTYGSNTSDYTDTNNYLYTGQSYWSITPVIYSSGGGGSLNGYIRSNGYLYNYLVNTNYGVRPVISLASGVTVTGSGTSSSPYVVQ